MHTAHCTLHTAHCTLHTIKMFSANSRYTPAQLGDGSYSIDADPDCFMVIINFLQVSTTQLCKVGLLVLMKFVAV